MERSIRIFLTQHDKSRVVTNGLIEETVEGVVLRFFQRCDAWIVEEMAELDAVDVHDIASETYLIADFDGAGNKLVKEACR